MKQMRWYIVFMLFVAGVISYLDRAALSVAAPLITKDLGLDPAELGIVFSSFFVGYSLFCFVGGQLADKYGAKKVLMIAMLAWSVFCILTAGVVGVLSLLLVRVVFGMGEGPYATCTNKMISEWFPAEKRTAPVGLANSGQQIGGAIAGPLVGLIAITWGWRVPFILIGLLGLVWLIFWRYVPSHKVSPAAVKETPQSGPSVAPEPTRKLSEYIKLPAVLATSLAFFGYAYILYFFLSWFPSFLMMERGLSLKDMSVANIFPWVFGAIGVVAGGFVCDAISAKIKDGIKAKKVLIACSLVVSAACVALAGQAFSITAALALMSAAALFTNLTLSAYWGIISDIVEPARRGGVGGFMHLMANTAGIIAPALTGFLVQSTGTFQSGFIISGAIALLGAIAVAVFVNTKPTQFAHVELQKV